MVVSDPTVWENRPVWRMQSEETTFAGSYRQVVTRRYDTPEGVRDVEIKVEIDSAVVVAVTLDGSILLVREFRPGTEEWLVELPGGNVDPGEEPEAAAARELLEETGYAATVRYVGSMVDCAYSTRHRHVFVADDAVSTQPSAEGLEIVLMPLPAFREHLRSGQLTDVGPGYRGLEALGLL